MLNCALSPYGLLFVMMEGREWHRRWQRIVATLFLCSLALGLTYFSWRGLAKALKLGKNSEVKKNVFSGKELESELGSSSAIVAEIGLNDALILPDTKVAEDMVKGAAWRLSNSSLHCGRNKMKFKVIGPGAAELQLDIGNAEPVPLSQVPDACGILVTQTTLEVVLLVPYDGCAVIQENGTYVLTMRWRASVFNITCTMLPKAQVNATLPVHAPLKAHLPHKSLSLYRLKRHSRWRPMYVPCSPYRRYPLCLYTTPPPATTTTTTTTTTTRRPLYQNPYFWKKLLALYPLYAHYVKEHTLPVQHNYHAYKYPGWQMHPQENQKPEIFNHPFYNILSGYLTPTTPTVAKTPSNSHCPHSRAGPFARLLAERAFGNHEIPEDQQNLSPQIRAPYKGHVNPDSFWESFPLLDRSANQEDPQVN